MAISETKSSAANAVNTVPTPPRPSKTVATVLGEITWLLSQSASHRFLRVADFEWQVMPPILLKQFKLFYDTSSQPIGVATWAMVTPELFERISNGEKMMRPEQWKCGDKKIIVDLIAPFGGEDKIREVVSKL